MYFDGTTTVRSAAGVSFGDHTTFTVEGWLKTDAPVDFDIVKKESAVGTDYFHVRLTAAQQIQVKVGAFLQQIPIFFTARFFHDQLHS